MSEPADPFGARYGGLLGDVPHGEALWEQLASIAREGMWSEFRRAIDTLDENDLRSIVVARLVAVAEDAE